MGGDCSGWLRFWVVEILGGWNGLWAVVRTGFVGYGGWLACFGLSFFVFHSPICGFEWSVECRGGGGWVCADLVVIWVVEWWWFGFVRLFFYS